MLLTKADEIRNFYTLSPPLELCSAARGQGSRVTLGETDICELCSPREDDVGCDPEHLCELGPVLSPHPFSNLARESASNNGSMQLNVLCVLCCSRSSKRSRVCACWHACVHACVHVCCAVGACCACMLCAAIASVCMPVGIFLNSAGN